MRASPKTPACHEVLFSWRVEASFLSTEQGPFIPCIPLRTPCAPAPAEAVWQPSHPSPCFHGNKSVAAAAAAHPPGPDFGAEHCGDAEEGRKPGPSLPESSLKLSPGLPPFTRCWMQWAAPHVSGCQPKTLQGLQLPGEAGESALGLILGPCRAWICPRQSLYGVAKVQMGREKLSKQKRGAGSCPRFLRAWGTPWHKVHPAGLA